MPIRGTDPSASLANALLRTRNFDAETNPANNNARPQTNGLDDHFEAYARTNPITTIAPASSAKADALMNNFETKLTKLLHRDAASMARGHFPVTSSNQMSEVQKDGVQSALKDLLMEMPVGALSPKLMAKAKEFFQSKDIDTKGIETKNIKEYGALGGELVKDLVKDFRESSPKTFYGIAAAAGLAIGAHGYLNGSDALKGLGIKPEFRTKLFNDKLELKAEGQWGKKFKDPSIKINTDTKLKFNSLDLRIRSALDSADFGRSTLSVGVSSGNAERGFNTGTDLGVDTIGFRVGAYAKFDDTSLAASATFDSNFDFTGAKASLDTKINDGTLSLKSEFNSLPDKKDLSASLHYSSRNLGVNGTYSHDFINDSDKATLSADYSYSDNLDISAYGSHDSEQGSSVGVGLTWNF